MSERRPLVLRTTHHASFHHLDPSGHVSAPYYLGYFLDHRWQGYRERLGLDLAALGKLPFFLVVRRATIEYLRPIFGDERFEITSRLEALGDVDATVACELRTGEGKLAATAQLNLVTVSKETKRPMPPTPDFLAMLYEPNGPA